MQYDENDLNENSGRAAEDDLFNTMAFELQLDQSRKRAKSTHLSRSRRTSPTQRRQTIINVENIQEQINSTSEPESPYIQEEDTTPKDAIFHRLPGDYDQKLDNTDNAPQYKIIQKQPKSTLINNKNAQIKL